MEDGKGRCMYRSFAVEVGWDDKLFAVLEFS
jgi:hypothetical protein